MRASLCKADVGDIPWRKDDEHQISWSVSQPNRVYLRILSKSVVRGTIKEYEMLTLYRK